MSVLVFGDADASKMLALHYLLPRATLLGPAYYLELQKINCDDLASVCGCVIFIAHHTHGENDYLATVNALICHLRNCARRETTLHVCLVLPYSHTDSFNTNETLKLMYSSVATLSCIDIHLDRKNHLRSKFANADGTLNNDGLRYIAEQCNISLQCRPTQKRRQFEIDRQLPSVILKYRPQQQQHARTILVAGDSNAVRMCTACSTWHMNGRHCAYVTIAESGISSQALLEKLKIGLKRINAEDICGIILWIGMNDDKCNMTDSVCKILQTLRETCTLQPVCVVMLHTLPLVSTLESNSGQEDLEKKMVDCHLDRRESNRYFEGAKCELHNIYPIKCHIQQDNDDYHLHDEFVTQKRNSTRRDTLHLNDEGYQRVQRECLEVLGRDHLATDLVSVRHDEQNTTAPAAAPSVRK